MQDKQRRVGSYESEEFGTVYAIRTEQDLAGLVNSEEPDIASIKSKGVIKPNGQYLQLDEYPHRVFYLDVSRAHSDELDGLLADLGIGSFRGAVGKSLLIWDDDPYNVAVAAIPLNYEEQQVVRAAEQILKEEYLTPHNRNI